MTHATWDTIANIPWWLYAVFIFAIKLGFDAKRPRIISTRHLWASVITTLSSGILVFYFANQLSINPPIQPLYMLGCLPLGIFAGYFQLMLSKAKALPNENKLYIPGSYPIALILALIVCAKFYTGFNEDILQTQIMPFIFEIYSFLFGLAIGRTIYGYRCLTQHQSLKGR